MVYVEARKVSNEKFNKRNKLQMNEVIYSNWYWRVSLLPDKRFTCLKWDCPVREMLKLEPTAPPRIRLRPRTS